MNIKKLNGRACIRILIVLACLIFYVTKSVVVTTILSVIIVALMLLEIYRVPKYSVAVLLFFSFEAMGLLPSIKVGLSTLSWEDLSIVVVIWLFFIMRKVVVKKDKVGLVVLLFLISRVVGAVIGYFIYNQSIITGLLVLRPMYIYLAYYPIIIMYNTGRISKNEILSEIFNFIKVISLVYLFELLLLYVGIDISSFSHTVRWGYRIYASNIPQMVGVFWCLVTLMKTNAKKEEKSTVGWLILFIFEVIFINQSRMAILCTIFTSGIIILLSPSVKNKFWIILTAVIVGVFSLSTSTVQGIIIDSVTEAESTEGGNILYRTYEKNYFENLLEGHELLGVGTPNQNYGEAAVYNGKQQSGFAQGSRGSFYMSGYTTSDLGIFGIRYYWGIVGLAIYEVLSIIALMYQIKEIFIYKKYEYEILIPAGINIFGFLASLTLCYYITRPGLYFIFFILQGIYIAERRREKQNEDSLCSNMV